MKSKVILSPLERYKYYGRYPDKFALHIALIILSSVLSVMLVANYNSKFGPVRVAFFSKFLSTDLNDYQIRVGEYPKIMQFYNIEDLQKKVNESVEYYKSIKKSSDDNMMIANLSVDDDANP